MMKIYKYTTSGTNLFDPSATDTTKGYVSGKYLNNDGTMTDNVDWSISEYIEIPEGTTQLTFTVVGNAPSVCLYDANKEFKIGENYNNRTTFTISTQNKYKYFRLSYKMIYESDYSVTSNALGWREAKGYQYTHGKNLFDYTTMAPSSNEGYISVDGDAKITHDGWKYTDYIPAIGKRFKLIKPTSRGQAASIALYDSSKNFITAVTYDSKSEITITTTSNNVAYIRFSYFGSGEPPLDTLSEIELYDREVKWREATAHEYSSGSWD